MHLTIYSSDVYGYMNDDILGSDAPLAKVAELTIKDLGTNDGTLFLSVTESGGLKEKRKEIKMTVTRESIFYLKSFLDTYLSNTHNQLATSQVSY